MKGIIKWLLVGLVLPLADTAAVGRNDQKNHELEESLVVKMPPYLNEAEFNKVTSEQLTLVEFFSPYCHHCKALYPTWERTYKEFYPEMVDLGIDMRQVDCVESGDLCANQDVYFYPNIRLYGPSNGNTKFLGSFPRMLDRNPQNFKSFLREAYSEYKQGVDLPSVSELLNSTQIEKLVEGDVDQAWFVTFYPGTDKQWLETEKTGKNKFSEQCYDCHDFKIIWDKLSNQIQSIFKTGHVNCFDNKEICELLGFDKLARSHNAQPQFAYFLPKHVGQIRLDYTGEVDLKSMKAHSQRLFENYQYEKVTSAGILDLLEYKPGLFHKPLDYEFPLQNKVAIIYFYDQDEDNEVDREILPKILKYISDSPFNLNLYTAKHKKIDADIKEQAENMIKYINYHDDANYKFDLSQYLAQTLTTKPTLLVLKDNTLITNVYQTFTREDINDFDKVEKFISENKYPLYQELTPSYLPHYFTRKGDPNDKVVVTFIDSKNPKSAKKELYNFSLAAHEYNFIKKQYYLESKLTADQATKLAEMNGESMAVIQQLQQEIPQFYENNDVLFTYLDLSALGQYDNVKNWKIQPGQYNVGDVIIVSKDYKKFWNHDINGDKLTNSPQQVTQLLASFLDPSNQVDGKLIGPVYGGIFSFMNRIHEHGIMGYIGLIGVVFVAQFTIRKWRRRAGSAPRGIIGNLPKKD